MNEAPRNSSETRLPDQPLETKVHYLDSKVEFVNLAALARDCSGFTKPLSICENKLTSPDGTFDIFTRVTAESTSRKDGQKALGLNGHIVVKSKNASQLHHDIFINDNSVLLRNSLWGSYLEGRINHGDGLIGRKGNARILPYDAIAVGLIGVESYEGQNHHPIYVSINTDEIWLTNMPLEYDVVWHSFRSLVEPDPFSKVKNPRNEALTIARFAQAMMLLRGYANSFVPAHKYKSYHFPLYSIERFIAMNRSKLLNYVDPADTLKLNYQLPEYKEDPYAEVEKSRVPEVEKAPPTKSTAIPVIPLRFPGLHPEDLPRNKAKSESSSSNRNDNNQSSNQYRSTRTEDYMPDKMVEEVSPKYSFDDIGGLEQVKEKLSDLAYLFKRPEVAKEYDVDPTKGILLFGPPGTGKTMLAHAMAKATGSSLWIVDSTKIHDMWMGLSSKNMQKLFDQIGDFKGPLVVLFDEIDGIVSTPAQIVRGADFDFNQVGSVFKTNLSTIHDKKPNLIIVGATNHKDKIDEAVLRSGRFDTQLYIAVPDEIARRQIIADHLYNLINRSPRVQDIVADDVDATELATAAEGLTGADLTTIFNEIKIQKAIEKIRQGKVSLITNHDILNAIYKFRRQG